MQVGDCRRSRHRRAELRVNLGRKRTRERMPVRSCEGPKDAKGAMATLEWIYMRDTPSQWCFHGVSHNLILLALFPLFTRPKSVTFNMQIHVPVFNRACHSISARCMHASQMATDDRHQKLSRPTSLLKFLLFFDSWMKTCSQIFTGIHAIYTLEKLALIANCRVIDIGIATSSAWLGSLKIW